MNIGKLRHRAALFKMIQTRNELGEVLLTPVQYGWGWCDVEDVGGVETSIGGRKVVVKTANLRMRYNPDIAARDRITAHGKTYEVESFQNTRDKNEELLLSCRTLDE